MGTLELWGGVECTVNRIADDWFDQVHRTGHQDRPGDLDRFAALGISALRYPVLWERVAPNGLLSADWSWTDSRLTRLQQLGVRPIAGLLHHGSGPRSTSLVDPGFPEAFAAFAAAVAERYPWVEDYTPINEPLTTARFSALYGHWYPHLRDDRAFATALLNETKGTILAMRAIRKVNPAARLIQTEDGGRTFSTPRLAHQAALENDRRWLTVDLLTGRVNRDHPLWRWLIDICRTPQQDLEWLIDNSCPPDVVGLNYYFTSDRYIDESLEHYPDWSHGGNHHERYADVEAVRAVPGGLAGHQRILEDAWQRYHLPVAITEVHAGCSREDQMRWLVEAWTGAQRARASGADVRAVTLWALLGSLDWNSLLVRCQGFYEPGAFDIRSSPPRATALASVARALATGSIPEPVALEQGWWRRPSRLVYGRHPKTQHPPFPSERRGARTLIVTGAGGSLGSSLVRACTNRGLEVVALSRHELDITDPVAVDRTIRTVRPWGIINAAGYVRVDDAEVESDECLRINADAAALLASACEEAGIRFVTFSSDLVFDGQKRRPYLESDRAMPLSVYGVSKLDAESRVASTCRGALIIRTSAFFGPADQHNFVTVTLRRLAAGERVLVAADTVVSPTYLPDLVDATLDLLVDGEAGIWHLANAGEVTWAQLARDAASHAGLDTGLIRPVPMVQIAGPAPRPVYSVLGSERGTLLPPLEDALTRYTRDAAHWRSLIPNP